MRRIFLISLFLLSCLASFGQTFRFDTLGSNRQVMVHKDGAQFLNILGIPGDTTTVGIPVNHRRGLIAMVAGVFYYHDGNSWITPAEGSSVVSVNGFTGVVNLTTTNIPEGTNLYFTDARVYNDSAVLLAYVKTLIAGKVGYADTAHMLLHYMHYGDSISIYATMYGLDTADANIRNWANSRFITSFSETDPFSFHKVDSNTHGNAVTFDYVKNNFYPLGSNPAGYLVTETDPIFTASIAYWLTALDTTHYNTAYLKYPSALSFNSGTGVLTLTRNDGSTLTTNMDGRYLTSFSETDPVATAKTITVTQGSGVQVTGTSSQTEGSNPLWVIGLPDIITSGTYGSSSVVLQLAVNAHGSITGITTLNVTPAFSNITGLPTLQALWVTAYKRNANYNANPWEFVPFIDTSANDTLFLPNAPGDSTIVGAKIVKQSGSFTTTIMCQGTDSMNVYGNTNFATLNSQYESISLIYKKATKIWTVISNDITKTAIKNLFSLTTTGNSGPATYDAATGAFNIPQYTAAGLGAVTAIVVNSLNPLFTASVTVTGTSATVDFSKISVGAHTWYGNPSALSGNPSFTFPKCSDLSDAAVGMVTFLNNATSNSLAATLTDETGSGSAVFSSGPTLSNPIVGTQAAGDNSTKAASTAYVETYYKDTSCTYLATVNPVTPVANKLYNVTYNLTAATGAIFIANSTSTWANGQILILNLKGTAARAITYGNSYVAGSDVTPLPASTSTTKTLVEEFMYNANDGKMYLVGKADGF